MAELPKFPHLKGMTFGHAARLWELFAKAGTDHPYWLMANMESNASERQKCTFISKHGGNTSYYTFTHF